MPLHLTCILLVPALGVLDRLRFEGSTVGWGLRSGYWSVEDAEEPLVLLAYSPLHTAPKGEVPAHSGNHSRHDDHVYPAHSFNSAALQAAQGGDSPVLARIDSKSGHGGGKPAGKLIDEYTDELAFHAKTLKIAY